MDTSRALIHLAMILMMSTLFIGCSEMQTRDNASGSSGINTSSASGQSAAVVDAASGTQGDTLAACMARIPGDATAGQRQMAEFSCQRDDRARQPIMAVPGQ